MRRSHFSCSSYCTVEDDSTAEYENKIPVQHEKKKANLSFISRCVNVLKPSKRREKEKINNIIRNRVSEASKEDLQIRAEKQFPKASRTLENVSNRDGSRSPVNIKFNVSSTLNPFKGERRRSPARVMPEVSLSENDVGIIEKNQGLAKDNRKCRSWHEEWKHTLRSGMATESWFSDLKNSIEGTYAERSNGNVNEHQKPKGLCHGISLSPTAPSVKDEGVLNPLQKRIFNLGLGLGLLYMANKYREETHKHLGPVNPINCSIKISEGGSSTIISQKEIRSDFLPLKSMEADVKSSEKDGKMPESQSCRTFYDGTMKNISAGSSRNILSSPSSSVYLELLTPREGEMQGSSVTESKQVLMDSENLHVHADSNENSNFSPIELERRLHELLQKRQEEQIAELETRLQYLEAELIYKEKELCWWKEQVSEILQANGESATSSEDKTVQLSLDEATKLTRKRQSLHQSVKLNDGKTLTENEIGKAGKGDYLSAGSMEWIDLEGKRSHKNDSLETDVYQLRISTFGNANNAMRRELLMEKAHDKYPHDVSFEIPSILEEISLQESKDDSAVPDYVFWTEKINSRQRSSMHAL